VQQISVLTAFEKATALLLDGLEAVAARAIAVTDALGCVVAEARVSDRAIPAENIAAVDGWALRSRDLVGASSYSPVMLAAPPVWVEAGDAMPDGLDCVLEAGMIERMGSLVQVVAEAIPGQNMRRAGEDAAQGAVILHAGLRLRPLDLLLARQAHIARLNIRQPRLHLLNIPAGSDATLHLIASSAREDGWAVTQSAAGGRDAVAIGAAIERVVAARASDLLVIVGGTGSGRTDATVTALAARGAVLAHGIAVQPGRTAAIGRVEGMPVIALPGAPDQAIAAWWTLVTPVLHRLSGAETRQQIRWPLARKIASSVGVAEIVLLKKENAAWMPLAIGDLTLDALARADAWVAIPGGSEGFAANTPVGAYMLRGSI
jgi:molybdopterin biosynthesis enzyme